MGHGESAQGDAGVGESGAGHDQHPRRGSDEDRGRGGEAEFGNPGGAELAQRGRVPARPDGGGVDQRPVDAEVVPPADQPALPAFEAALIQHSRSGPLPSARELAEYDRLLPGLAREIVDEARANMASDRKINELAVQTSAELDKRGQWIQDS